MTRPAAFAQGDIAKLLKGAKAAGMPVASVEIKRTGKIVAKFGAAGDTTDAGSANEWDEVLPNGRPHPPAANRNQPPLQPRPRNRGDGLMAPAALLSARKQMAKLVRQHKKQRPVPLDQKLDLRPALPRDHVGERAEIINSVQHVVCHSDGVSVDYPAREIDEVQSGTSDRVVQVDHAGHLVHTPSNLEGHRLVSLYEPCGWDGEQGVVSCDPVELVDLVADHLQGIVGSAGWRAYALPARDYSGGKINALRGFVEGHHQHVRSGRVGRQ